ncbi:uncharacterized protein BO96DRAFT_489384, partial [Aspergillus niger CBS 101883]|uniref:uncharacterized protein n=1 Tax=Aspergillus lacticoffeatus (strain CBS 101883) TaxID=1450533 RepID=UPI000D803EB0
EKVERESGKKLQVDVKFPLSKANRPGLPTSQKPTNNGDTGTVLVIFFTEGLPAEWRRKAKLSAEKKEKPMDPADDSVGLTQLTTWGPPSLPAANPVVRKEQRQKEVPFGCSILYFLPKYFAALLPARFPLVDKSDDSMADLLAPWPSLARSGSPPAFYDIMENRRWWPRDLPDGAGSSRGRVPHSSDHRDFPPLLRTLDERAILVRVIGCVSSSFPMNSQDIIPYSIDRYSFSKVMSPSTPDLHAPLMQYSLPNNYYSPALHLLRAGSRDPAENASAVTPPSSPFSSFHYSSPTAMSPLIQRSGELNP